MIIQGETGSGKTTQIPQFILEHFGLTKTIIVTQPRPVAAITVAERVAKEMDVPIGSYVGFAVRFDNKTSEQTKLFYMTDGLLLHHFQDFDIFVVDEAHERTLNSDIILGFLKQLSQTNQDIKIIVMSATIETEKFSTFFNHAKILKIPGQIFPLKIEYLLSSCFNYLDESLTKVLKQ